MKRIAIKILEYRVSKLKKKIQKYKDGEMSILAHAFSDAIKSYNTSIIFIKAEIDSTKKR